MLPACAKQDLIRQNRVNETCFDYVLEKVFLEKNDVSVYFDNDGSDLLLLPIVTNAMQRPTQLLTLADNVYGRFSRKDRKIYDVVSFCREIYGFNEADFSTFEYDIPDFPVPELGELYAAMVKAVNLFENAFRLLSVEDTKQIKNKLVQLLFQGTYRQGVLRHEQESDIEKAFYLASHINLEKMWEAFMTVAAAVDSLVERLENEDFSLPENSVVNTSLGNVVIGSMADDVYQGSMPLILISPGGNNIYQFSDHSGFHVIIDVSGNDTYFSSDRSFPGSGISGLGFLVDMQGDDFYRGENFSFGAGLLGAGLVADMAGNDRYESKVFSQGAAAMGMGVLFDKDGDDTYDSVLYSQGMGYVGGAGLLFDLKGNDVFSSGGVIPDDREEQGAFQTYSQGFGLGSRSFASGGVGILFCGSGDNCFNGSYFCQGSSYWRALGLLISGTGNDSFYARRYAQGAGIHSSVGGIVNYGGNNRYFSWGVSQGCGHDYGVGILVDKNGNDVYEADWLSQGAGISCGLGMLIDCEGENVYSEKSTCRGYGSYDDRRDSASIGILIDRHGKEKKLWRQGELGAGIHGCMKHPCVWSEPSRRYLYRKPDKENLGNLKKRRVQDAPLPELEKPLYLEDSWERASAVLSSRGAEILPYLVPYFGIKDVSVARTVEETIIKLAKTDYNGVKEFLVASERTSEEIIPVLYALGDKRCREAKDIFPIFLETENMSVKAVALRGIYRHGKSISPDAYKAFAESQNSTVRRYFALALGTSDDEEAVKILVNLLSDANFQVRYAAYRTLKEKGSAIAGYLKMDMKKYSMFVPWYLMAEDLLKQ